MGTPFFAPFVLCGPGRMGMAAVRWLQERKDCRERDACRSGVVLLDTIGAGLPAALSSTQHVPGMCVGMYKCKPFPVVTPFHVVLQAAAVR